MPTGQGPSHAWPAASNVDVALAPGAVWQPEIGAAAPLAAIAIVSLTVASLPVIRLEVAGSVESAHIIEVGRYSRLTDHSFCTYQTVVVSVCGFFCFGESARVG